MDRRLRSIACALAAVVVAALFAGALLVAPGAADEAQPVTMGRFGEPVPTTFTGRLARTEPRAARAILTAAEPGAGYAPIRARLTLELQEDRCPRPVAGRLRVTGPTGGGGGLDLFFDDADCARAIGTYRGLDGGWTDRSGVATIERQPDGAILVAIYP